MPLRYGFILAWSHDSGRSTLAFIIGEDMYGFWYVNALSCGLTGISDKFKDGFAVTVYRLGSTGGSS